VDKYNKTAQFIATCFTEHHLDEAVELIGQHDRSYHERLYLDNKYCLYGDVDHFPTPDFTVFMDMFVSFMNDLGIALTSNDVMVIVDEIQKIKNQVRKPY
jgi:hypothetical protein